MDTVVILADGVWEDDVQARDLAAAAELVIAADGGFAQALRAGARVDLVIGDLDSLDEASRRAVERTPIRVCRYPTAKDSSDLELALDEALSRAPQRILILGGLGRRIDHALTNIHLLERGLHARVPVMLVDGRQSIALVGGRHEIAEAGVGDCVSLIPLSSSVRASTVGLRYALADEGLERASSRGVSNEVSSLPARVDVTQGRLLVVHTRAQGAA